MDAMPKYIYNSITEITPEELRRIGAVAVGIDLDNTTVYDSTLRPREGVLPWIRKVKAAGIPIIIISNTYPLRARWISKKFGVPYLALSNKPDPKNVVKAASQIGVPLENFAGKFCHDWRPAVYRCGGGERVRRYLDLGAPVYEREVFCQKVCPPQSQRKRVLRKTRH